MIYGLQALSCVVIPSKIFFKPVSAGGQTRGVMLQGHVPATKRCVVHTEETCIRVE